MKTSLFQNDPRFFHTKIAQIAILFFCAIQLAYIILNNFHCDAISGVRTGGEVTPPPPPLKILKNENLSFWNEPPFLMQRLPKLLSYFSVLSNLHIKSWKTFIVMQQ